VQDQLEIIWSDLIPLKVSIFTWRLIQNKLPTKDNMVRRDTNILLGKIGYLRNS
jgi:hypothetical protein